MKIDETQLGTVRRGDLLEVAQFLTDFKSHFCYKDLLASLAEASRSPSAAKLAVISPLDVSNALEYRQLVNSRDDLEQEYYVSTQQELPSQRSRHFSKRHREGLKDSMDKLQVQLDKRPEREKIIHHLLLRFEIWTTKVVAQQVLLSSSGEIDQPTDTMKPCCYSPFLNLPSAKHFYSIMPPATGDLPSNYDIPSALHKYKPSCCCLPLPPNRQTWKEFAKFFQIIGILDSESLQKAKSSPCCVTNMTHCTGQKRNQSLAQDFQYQGHDLVPLWIRAKRNSQAMRQLWTLFIILPDKEEGEAEHWAVAGTGQRGSGKQIVAGLENPHPKSTSFKAVLQNNPKHTKSRVVELTKLVDQLVEWAVVNQVVFTHRHMRACIQACPQGKRRAQQLSGLYRRSAKRPRVEKNADDDVELMHASRAYVLRWFARRNRRVATVLFASNQDSLHLDVGCSRVDRVLACLLKDKVEEGIRQYLEKPEVSDIIAYKGDRTLARIDRRLFIRGRYDSDINMASQVLTLLQALGESAPVNQLDQALVLSAKSDFQEMYDHFFVNGKDAYDTARELLDVDTESTGGLAAILRSAPLPWVDKCCVCEAGPNERQLQTCANCEGVYHTKCSPPGKTSVRLANAVRAYEPLRDLCKINFPADISAPDFRTSGPTPVKWMTKIVTVDRPLRADGTPMPLGLMLRHTEECRDAFDALQAEECLVSVLAEMISVDKKKSRNSFPLAIDHIGYIITEVFKEQRGDFCGEKAGLAVGDVIMALEILSFADPKQTSQYQLCTTYTFSKLGIATRLDLLKQKTTKLKMIILRPSHNVVKTCTEWYTRIKRANKTMCAAFVQSVTDQESEARLWFCGDCVKERPTEETPRESAIILQEASVCRAVIRRLAMESYSLPFIDEKPNANEALSSQEKSHSKFVSLRRLDNMMTSIIEDHVSVKSTEDPSSLISKPLRNAFCVPPWAAGDMCRQRLDWAKENLEKQPMALLCLGIKHLLAHHGSDANDTKKEEKKSLSRHFLSVFCAWCVSISRGSRGTDFPCTKGPSKISLQVCAPWLQLSCSECMARSADRADSGFQICDNATCLMSSKGQGAGTELMGREEVLTIANATESYTHCASFVGATFLVLPEDPLVEAVSKIVKIDHDDRPVEFVVASYLPPDVVQGMKLSSRDDILDKFKRGDGIYHILPIVSFQQLKFLLDRCQTRNPPRKVEIGHDDYSWAALDVLNLEGVARFSPAELLSRIADHAGIRDAIDIAVVDKGIEASRGVSDSSTINSRRILDSRSFMSSQKLLSDADDPLPQYRHLIESLIYDASHVFRGMAPANNTESLSNAPSDFERDFGELPGGEKGCKKGLDIIIPARIPLSSGILQPEAVAENRCAVAYSDFYFENPDERASLESVLRDQTLAVPPRLVVKSKLVAPEAYYTILLNRVEKATALDSFKGIGWGVEIIQWKGEPALRIGRVCQPSIAYDAGLRTNDVVVEVSGNSPSAIGSQVHLICSFLGVPFRIPCKDYGLGAIAKVFSTIRSANIALVPVVLLVYRQPLSMESDMMNVDENGEASTPALDNDCKVVDVRNGAVQRSKRPHPIAPHSIAAGNMAPLARSLRSVVDANASRRLHANNDASPIPNRREDDRRWNTDNGVSLPPEWTHLYFHLTSNFSSRTKISSKNLYRPGISGMVFSLVETAVFCECVRQLQPLLGMRLLCPRYDLTTIFHQTAILKKAPPNLILTIPFIPDTIYWRLLRLDFQRASSTSHPEIGDPIFFEGVHQYRMPADRLPLDRYVESLFQDEAKQARQQPVPQQEPLYEHGATNGRSGGGRSPPGSQPYRGAPMNVYATSQIRVTTPHNRLRNHAYDNKRSPHASEFSRGRRDSPPSDRITNSAGEFEVATFLNPGSEYAIPDNSPQSGSTPERIRGGGPSSSMGPSDLKSGGGTSLDQILPDAWRHKPVYSKVQTSNEGVYSEATLIGFVKASKSSGVVPGKLDKAEIEAHYLSNIGYFDEPRTYEIESDSLFLIDININTEESRVVLKLQARNLGPKTSRDHPSRTKNPESTQPSVEENARIRAHLNDMTLSFMRRLGEMTVLGELPDGRDVIWLRSDPRSLYVRIAKDQSRKEELHQRASARAQTFYLRTVHRGDPQRLRISRSNRSQNFCVWGCSVKATSLVHETLSFGSHSDLEEHYMKCHTFGSTADITTLGDTGQFLRIQDGRHILELSSSLTSAICARRLSLIDDAVQDALQPETTSNGKVFYRSPQDLHLSFHLTQKFRGVVLDLLRENDPSLCRPINLWSRIARLFVLEEEGQFRLNPTEYQNANISPQESVGRVLACSCERTFAPDTEVSASGNFECELCALQWEQVTRFRRKDPPKIAPTNSVDAKHRSIGCALLSDASYPERLTSEVHFIPGRLGQAKSLLLKVALHMPEPLRNAGGASAIADPLVGYRIWNEDYFEVWSAFAKEATNTRMLAQALVTMLASIHRARLPRWWSNEGGGWSTAQALIEKPSLSAFFLHLYVLDAAIAEFMSTAYLKESSGKRVVSGSLAGRMEKYLKMADKLGFKRFSGAHEELCYFCDDGGSLLCCDLCENVQHHSCCDPPIENPDVLSTWICDSCINDINVRSKHLKDQGAPVEQK